MPTCACENDRVTQKVVDQVVKLVVKRGEEGSQPSPKTSIRYQIGYYMGLQQKHTADGGVPLGFTTRGKSPEEGKEVLVFMASKGASR